MTNNDAPRPRMLTGLSSRYGDALSIEQRRAREAAEAARSAPPPTGPLVTVGGKPPPPAKPPAPKRGPESPRLPKPQPKPKAQPLGGRAGWRERMATEAEAAARTPSIVLSSAEEVLIRDLRKIAQSRPGRKQT